MSQTRCHAPTLMRTISIPRLNSRLTSFPLHKFPLHVRPRIVMQKATHFITYGWLGNLAQGLLSATSQRAGKEKRETVYWPSLMMDINAAVAPCQPCNGESTNIFE